MKSRFCYIVVPGNPPSSAVGAVTFGESGYCPTTYDHFATLEDCRALVDRVNSALGVSEEVELAMIAGSMFGWSVPGAAVARLHFEKGVSG